MFESDLKRLMPAKLYRIPVLKTTKKIQGVIEVSMNIETDGQKQEGTDRLTYMAKLIHLF
jgi:hypothetical protein